MDSKIFQNLKTKQISESTLNLYMKNLIRLNDGLSIKNFNFLNDLDKILDKIKDKKPNTRRTYIISIVSLLKQEPKMKSLYDKYYAVLIEYNKDLKANTEKSESQKENWLTQDGVRDVFDKLEEKVRPNLTKKKLVETEYDNILQWVVLALYVLQCPRRNLDYSHMVIVKKFTDLLPKDKNYLDISNWTFYFNNYKTQKTYKTQAVEITEDMKKVLQGYFKFHPLKAQIGKINSVVPLLVNYKGEQPTAKNSITRILNKIFGRNVGCSLLRNIFLTSKYSGNVADLQKDVQKMGTSSETALNNYIKKE